MPRKPRFWVPNEPYHLISRFIDREYRLLDDTDRAALIKHLERANKRWDWQILAYCLLSTHVHVAPIAGDEAPGRFFQSAHVRFAAYHHRRYNSIGPVFASRPKQWRVRRPKLRLLVAYQHRNPVDAGIVARATDWRWSSHRALMRLDLAPAFLDVARALEVLGFDDTEAGRRELDEFVMQADLRDRQLYVEDELVDPVSSSPGERRISDELWRWTLSAVSKHANVPFPREDPTARAVLIRVVFGLSGATLKELATRVGLSPSRVGQIVDATPSLSERALQDKIEAALERQAA